MTSFRLRARGASGLVLAGGMAGAGPDALVADTLLTFHTTTDLTALTNPNEALPLLRRLVAGLLTDHAEPEPRHLALYLTRQGIGVSWPVERLLEICAGPAPRYGLREHRAALTEAVLEQTLPRSPEPPRAPRQ